MKSQYLFLTFVCEEIEEFQKIGQKFITIMEGLAKEVESEKIKAIGARNILQGMEKQKENHQQQLHVRNIQSLKVVLFNQYSIFRL